MLDEMTQNLSYFFNMKTQVAFAVFHFIFSLFNALVYVGIEQGKIMKLFE